ncbi:unnamed protein product [Closterium sp. Yama58-4]|nr:unnamed protein product [Closterium sp. Yama58-4]
MDDGVTHSLAESIEPSAVTLQRVSAARLPPHSAISPSPFPRLQAQRVDDGVARSLAEAFAATQQRAQEGGAAVKGSALVMMYARHASELMVDVFKKARSKGGEGAAVEGGVEEFDISGGKREALNKEAAEKLLAPLLKPNNDCKKVKLTSKVFTLEAAEVALQALTNARDTLTHADLSDIIASLPEEEALQVITRVTSALEGCNLHSLKLSENVFGEKGAAAVALTSQPWLRQLYFCNNGISKEAAVAIRELLPTQVVASLETLHFFNNMSGELPACLLSSLASPLWEVGSWEVGSQVVSFWRTW